MPKGQQRKIKDAICNEPVECNQTCNQLRHPPDRSGIVRLKLKRKLQFRGHVYYQAVWPELIQQVLNWLKVHNPFYKDIVVDINNIDSNLTTLQNDADNNNTHQQATSNNGTTDSDPELEYDASENDKFNSNEEENYNPLNEYGAPVCETCLESIITNYPVITDSEQSTGDEVYSIMAPGENKHSVSFMLDKQCKELALLVLFPKGRYGSTAERQVTISPVRYFDARL